MIDIHCPYFGIGGMWRHARSFVTALARYEDIALHPWETPKPEDGVTAEERAMLARPAGTGSITIGIGPILQMTWLAALRHQRRIAYVAWEPNVLSQPQRQILAEVDQIWVPSHWGKAVLVSNGLASARIHVVPEGVDGELFQPVTTLPPAGNERPFRFLSVGKWEERKGTADLVRTFARTFGPGDPVELVLHCGNRFLEHFDVARAVRDIVPRNAPPIVLSSAGSDQELAALYQSCDAFVLPTKAEGWGLPIIEAMACGLPVIVTGYSGHCDYVDDSCGYLIRVARMKRVKDPIFYRGGAGRWAQPDLAHLAQLLRHVMTSREEARAVGLRASERVRTHWTWDAAARIAHAELQPFQRTL